MLTLDPNTTALVLIDLQRGILGRPLAPHSADAVQAAAKDLATRFRAAGALVVLVHVGFAADYSDAPQQAVDEPMALPAGGLPAGWMEFVDGLAQPGDVVIHKRQWGAFYGTGLELQLRRRGIQRIVLGGVATNIGVESTARDAWERGFELVLVEDACATHTAEMHAFAFKHIFPRIARVTTAQALGFAGAAATA